MSKLLAQDGHELVTDLVLLVVALKLVSLHDAGISANRAHVDHTVSELDKGTALDGDVEVGHVVQDELDQLLVVFFTDVADEGLRLEGQARLVGRQAVLGEAEVEERGHSDGAGAELLLLLGEVAAADEANGDLLSERGEESQHLWRHVLWS
jgi:hypothetical protein